MKNILEVVVRALIPDDWPAIREIYLEGIATAQATFETAAPSWENWDAGHLPFARLAAVSATKELVGWAALSRVSARKAYEGVAEVSIYVKNEFKGLGVGRTLLNQLIQASEEHGIWTLQASVFPENHATLALHRSCGFLEVGRRAQIGKLGDMWRDTLLLERRSSRVGTD